MQAEFSKNQEKDRRNLNSGGKMFYENLPVFQKPHIFYHFTMLKSSVFSGILPCTQIPQISKQKNMHFTTIFMKYLRV